jgi:hypothetical protein
MCDREGAAAGRDLATLEGRLAEVISITAVQWLHLLSKIRHCLDSVSSAEAGIAVSKHLLAHTVVNAFIKPLCVSESDMLYSHVQYLRCCTTISAPTDHDTNALQYYVVLFCVCTYINRYVCAQLKMPKQEQHY